MDDIKNSWYDERKKTCKNITKYIGIYAAIRKVKNTWMARQCREIEKLYMKHNIFQEIKRWNCLPISLRGQAPQKLQRITRYSGDL